VAAPADPARKRRANVLLGLLAMASFFGAGALSSGSSLVLGAFVLSLVLLAGYVVLVAQAARADEERVARGGWAQRAA
jgi:hypothetical protein